MSFPKRLIQLITLFVFFFLMAGFVAYRSGAFSSPVTASDPESEILTIALASMDGDTAANRFSEGSHLSSSKVGIIATSGDTSSIPQDTTRKKKKTKDLGIALDPSITHVNNPFDSARVMTREDSLALFRKTTTIMSSSKSTIVTPPRKLSPKKKKKD